MAYISLNTAKKHLNIESGYTADDAYVTALIDVVEGAVEQDVNEDLDELAGEGGIIPAPLSQAMLILLANLYQNREGVGKGLEQVPFSYQYLIDLYRNYNN